MNKLKELESFMAAFLISLVSTEDLKEKTAFELFMRNPAVLTNMFCGYCMGATGMEVSDISREMSLIKDPSVRFWENVDDEVMTYIGNLKH